MLKCTASWVFIIVSIIITIFQINILRNKYYSSDLLHIAFYTTAFVAVNEITNCKYIIVISILYAILIMNVVGRFHWDKFVLFNRIDKPFKN